jgi:thiol-disulfide isomerase/thioredoxin
MGVRLGKTALAVALGAGLWGCGGSEPRSAPAGGGKGNGPELVSVNGAQLMQRVRSSQAQVVLVNVWATWCVPCREEFPALLQLARSLPQERLDLVLVSADFPDQAEAARRFLASQGVAFPSYLKEGGDEEFIDALAKRWSGALPATFVFNRQRDLVRFWEGGASFEEFRAAVEAAAQSSEGEGEQV